MAPELSLMEILAPSEAEAAARKEKKNTVRIIKIMRLLWGESGGRGGSCVGAVSRDGNNQS